MLLVVHSVEVPELSLCGFGLSVSDVFSWSGMSGEQAAGGGLTSRYLCTSKKMFLVLPSGLVTLSRSGPASVGSAAADEYVLPGMSSQWSGATLRMAVTAAWTVSAHVEVVTSCGSFMIPKMTLGLSAYLVARDVQSAANSVLQF